LFSVAIKNLVQIVKYLEYLANVYSSKSEKHDLEKSEKTRFGDYVKPKHSTALWLDISRLISKLVFWHTHY